MSDNRNHPASEPIDWAERLKSSLEQDTDELQIESSHVDDDLAALLRAQIHHSEQAFSKTVNDETHTNTGAIPKTEAEIIVETSTPEMATIASPELLPESLSMTIEDSEDFPDMAEMSETVVTVSSEPRVYTTDAHINPPSNANAVTVSDTDSRLAMLSQRNEALLNEFTRSENLQDEIPVSEDTTAECLLDQSASTVVPAPIASPRPADLRDADPLIADTTEEDEVFHPPLQTDFCVEDDCLHRTEGKRTPKVSRMFGVYRITETPSSAKVPIEKETGKQVYPYFAEQTSDSEPVCANNHEKQRRETFNQSATSVRSEIFAPDSSDARDASKIDKGRISAQTVPPIPRRETPAIRVNREYTDPSQAEGIHAAYRRSMNRQPLLFLLALAGSVPVMLFDLLPLLIVNADDFLQSVGYPLMELAIMMLICIPFFTRLRRGLLSLFDYEPTRYALSAMALLVCMTHALIACFAPLGHRTMPLFGGIALVMLAVSSFSECMATAGEQMAFSLISKSKQAFLLTTDETPASRAYAELTDNPPRDSRRILTGVRIGHVSDYFARTSRYNAYMGRINYFLPVSMLLSLLAAGLSVILGGHPYYDGVRIFTATYLACIPCGYLLTMSLPLMITNYQLSQRGATIIGTAGPTDYVSHHHTAIILPEGALISPIKTTVRSLANDPHADTYALLTEHLLRLLDMPGASPAPLPHGWQLEISEQGTDFLRVFLLMRKNDSDDIRENPTEVHAYAVEVMLGSHEALVRRGIRLPKRAEESQYLTDSDARVLYLAFDRRFRRLLATTLSYEKALRADKQLSNHKHSLVIAGYDPLHKPEDTPSLTYVCPTTIEPYRAKHTGALLATHAATDLIEVYEAAVRVKSTYRLAQIISWLWIATVGAFALWSIFNGFGDLITTNAAILFQLVGILIMVSIHARFFVSDKKPTTKASHTASSSSSTSATAQIASDDTISDADIEE